MTTNNHSMLLDKVFVFITGIEGSGTTMMLRVLDVPDNVIVLGGNYCSPSLEPLTLQLNALTEMLWNCNNIPNNQERKEIIHEINALHIPRQYTHVVHKRSFPFLDINHWPILPDLKYFSRDIRLLVLHRDIQSNTRSILRRGFEVDSKIADNRSLMASRKLDMQLSNFSAPYLSFLYEDMIDHRKKHKQLMKLVSFLSISRSNVKSMEKIITKPTETSNLNVSSSQESGA